MRVVKWICGIALGLVLLAFACALILMLFVDPNRFKGRIEVAVTDATGLPFKIDGDLDISWYPWLAVQMGPAQLGEGEPLLKWKSARVGARLIPLLQGRLLVGRVRVEGLRAHLQRASDGRGNWQDLLANRTGSHRWNASGAEFGGLQIRDGAVEFADEREGTHFKVTDLRLDVGQWRPGQPFAVETRFVLQNGAPSALRLPIALQARQIQMQTAPIAVSIPVFELQLASAHLSGSLAMKGTGPLRAEGGVVVRAASLRQLLADFGIRGARLRDATALGAFKLTARWMADDGAVAVDPLEIQMDQTKVRGHLGHSKGTEPVWSFNLQGDHVALDRYTDFEEDNEPFELPTAQLKALRMQGVMSFDEAQLAGAQLKNVRLRLELKDGKLHEP